VVDRQPAFRHEFLEITETERETKVPANTGHDRVGLKLAFPEGPRPTSRHAVTLPNPQMQQFPDSV